MSNKFIIYVTIIALILILGIPTYIKVNNSYKERVILTLENKIKVKAIQCWNEKKCLDNTIYLSNLYELNYLDTLINPLTKKAVNKSSYVEKVNDKIIVKLYN